MKFEELRLDPRLLTQVARMGYKETTPIQSLSIPLIMQGKDVLGQAQTGTGKTAAFALPIMDRLLKLPAGSIRVLILAPTRELAEQIHTSFGDLGREAGIRSVAVYGGISMGPQIRKLRARPDIVVACPGRLLDHMRNGTVDLSEIDVLVLDEADRMLDMGFLHDIRAIMNELPVRRQTLLFSATLTMEIRRLASEFMSDPQSVDIGHSAPVETVSHAIYPVEQHLKTALLIDLLRKTDARSVIVFTRTKHRANRVGTQLRDAGFSAVSFQGNLSQGRRQEALDGFRKGSYKVLVATDIAARGIDVSSISHVINYDMPDTADAYTHRIGRTGRVDRTGDAFTLVTGEDRDMVRTIERLVGYPLERRVMEGFDNNAEMITRRVSADRRGQFPFDRRKPDNNRKPPYPRDPKDHVRQAYGVRSRFRSHHR
ncbi:MAG: DEAD/DEAH box helicase [Candidatus Thermoplasmatota archaeon]|nr:DEAD/DEAH box helicase [Candidatus Thermoplasmatota archaeon]